MLPSKRGTQLDTMYCCVRHRPKTSESRQNFSHRSLLRQLCKRVSTNGGQRVRGSTSSETSILEKREHEPTSFVAANCYPFASGVSARNIRPASLHLHYYATAPRFPTHRYRNPT